MTATTIADRKNGETILAEWFNILKQELVSIQDSPIIVSADYVATADFRTIYVDASSADVVITLPDPTLTDNFGKQWTIRVLDNQNFDVSVDCAAADFENVFDPDAVVNPYVFRGNEIGASFQSNGSTVWRIRNNYALPVMEYDYTSDLISPLNANCSIASLNDILFNQYLSSINGEGLVKYESSKWQMSSDSGVTWFDVVGALNTQSIANKIITGSSLSDSQLILKTDTKANLITYALTATNGELVFASDEELYYGIVSGLLVSLGGGGSSAFLGLTDTPSSYAGQKGKVAKVNDTETAIVFEEESGGGSPSLYLNLDADIIKVADFTDNTVNGSFTEDTTETDNIRYKLTNAVGADGEDVVFTKAIASDVQKRRTHICKIYNSEYDGTKGNVTLILTDQDDNELSGSPIIIDPSLGYQKKIFTTADTVTSIKVKPTIVTGEVSTWVFDKVVLDYNVLGETTIERKESYEGYGHTLNSTNYMTFDSVNSNISEYLELDTSVSYVRFKVIAPCYLSATFNIYWNAAASQTAYIEYNSNITYYIARNEGTNAVADTVSITDRKAEIGDLIAPRFFGGVLESSRGSFSISATATADYVLVEDEREQAHVVASLKLEGNSGEAITASTENIPFAGTSEFWTSGTGLTDNYYTVQRSDTLGVFYGAIHFNGAITGAVDMYLSTDGVTYSLYKRISSYDVPSGGTVPFKYEWTPYEFTVGDRLSIRYSGNGTLANITTRHYLNITETYLPPADQATVQTLNALPVRAINDFDVDATSAGVLSNFNGASDWVSLVSHPSAGLYNYTLNTDIFTEFPSITADINVSNHFGAVTLGVFPAFSIVSRKYDGSVNDQIHRFSAKKRGADRDDDGLFLGDCPKVVHSNNEFYTGEDWIDGRKIYGRSFEIASNISTTTTIATLDTGLEITNGVKLTSSLYVIPTHSYQNSSSDKANFRYDSTTGVLDYEVATQTVYAGTKVTIKYVK